MGNPIGVNRNVYQSVKNATADNWNTSPKISKDELKTIETAIAADGKVDSGERQLLDALKNKTSFSVKSAGTAPYNVESSLLSFDKSNVSNSATGNVTGNVAYSDGDGIQPVPSHLPEQTVGRQTNHYETRTGGDYTKQREALLDVNNWSKSGMTSADFQLMDKDGKEVNNRKPKEGDFLRIDLAFAPTGYDYVQIDKIIDNDDMTSITVRPSKDPTSTSPDTHHFFTDDATNTFTLRRSTSTDGQPLSVMQVNGRNEVSNSGAINSTVSWGAENTPMQSMQWEGLLDHVLDAK
jgi:hypothetical protein